MHVASLPFHLQKHSLIRQGIFFRLDLYELVLCNKHCHDLKTTTICHKHLEHQVHQKLKINLCLAQPRPSTARLGGSSDITTGPSVKTSHRLGIILARTCTDGVSIAIGGLFVGAIAQPASLANLLSPLADCPSRYLQSQSAY